MSDVSLSISLIVMAGILNLLTMWNLRKTFDECRRAEKFLNECREILDKAERKL